MIKPKVKICGITNLEDARFAAGAFVDFLGFIFYEKSPRFIDPAKAGAMLNWIEGPKKVGVFVNQPWQEVNQIAKETGLDYVQLHGNESIDYCQQIEKPIIKAIPVSREISALDLKSATALYSQLAEYYLFDTKLGADWGGTGQTFDWKLLEEISVDKPFFLAGGITPENAVHAINNVHPFAIDVNSGVEEKPGLKDFEKIEQLMENIQNEN